MRSSRCLKKARKRWQVIVAGAERDGVDIVSAQRVEGLGQLRPRRFGETRASASVAGVDLDLFAGLSVFQCDEADVGQCFLPLVVDVDGDEIVPPARDR